MSNILMSGVVVCYNEAHLLERCFESIDFCDEIILVDMGSEDGSVEAARELGAHVTTHELVPYPNLARQHGIRQARHEWIVTIDLDEVFPRDSLDLIEKTIRDRPDLAGIRLPWQFYFRGKKLSCTDYAHDKTKCVVVHRDRIETTPFVHKEFLADGPQVHTFAPGEIGALDHYWMTTWPEFFDKMGRYIRSEGESRYHVKDQRFSWTDAAKHSIAALKLDLVDYDGWRGGLTGIFLSFFRAYYVLMGWMSLRRYERVQTALESQDAS